MHRVFSRLRLLCSLACAFALAVPLAAPLAAQSLSPTGPANFGSVNVGSTANLTLTFSAPAATTISSVTALTDGVTNRDFLVAQQNCVGTVTSCSIQLSFSPTAAGPRHGYLALLGATGNIVSHAYLYGIGVNGQVSYTPSSITVATSAAALSPTTFSPAAATQDGAGNLYFNDIANNRLLKLTTAGVYSSVGSLPGNVHSSLTFSGDGTVFASSPTQGMVYAVQINGTLIPISAGSIALVTPTGLATDGLGNLYIADAGTNHIVRVALDGSGSSLLTLTGITLSSPAGMVVDASNNLYIVDSGNDRVVELNLNSSAASVVTISGLSLSNPSGIAIDPAGTLYIADTGNKRIVTVPTGGAASVLPTTGATLSIPSGINVSLNGNLMLADSGLGLVSVNRSSLTVTFPTATRVNTVDTTDGFQTFTVQNTGNIVLAFAAQPSGSNPTISSANFTYTGGTSTCPIATTTSSSAHIALGASCTYTVEFTPVAIGTDTSTFTMYLSDAGTSGVTDAPFVTLTGTGLSSLAKFSIVATPSSVLVGAPESFTVTALNSSGGAATDFTGTVTFTSTDTTAVFLGGTTYTFTTADAGVHTFSGATAVDFHQPGSFTLSATGSGFTAVSNAVQVQAQTITTLTATPNPVGVGNHVTLTATVTSTYAGATPTGTVTFSSVPTPGATAVSLGTVTLTASGTASLVTSFSTGGNPCITATYSGDGNFVTSTSPSVCESVGDFSLTLDSNSSANATVLYSKPVSYTFDVAPVDSSTIANTINFTVSGLGTTPYTLTPTTINAGSGASTIKLTITPAAPAALQTRAFNRIAPLTLALLAVPFVWVRRRKLSSLLAIVALTALLVFPTGCSSSSGYFNPAFTLYKITVTGTSGSVTHSTTVTLTAE